MSLVGLTIAYDLTKHEPTQDLVQHLLVSMADPHSVIFDSLNPVNCVTWSLETEIQFYAFLPLIALVLFRARPAIRRAVLMAFVLLGCVLAYSVKDSFRLSLTLLGWSQYFMVGILIADLRQGWEGERTHALVGCTWSRGFRTAADSRSPMV